MNEFLKLKWKVNDVSEFEKPEHFIPEDIIIDSLIYKNLDKPIRSSTKKIKIFNNSGQIVPGEQYFLTKIGKSSLSSVQQEHCLKALKILQSGKDFSKLTQSENYSINIYNELKEKIHKENQNYFNYAERNWTESQKFICNMKIGFSIYAKKQWKFRCNRYLKYPQLYKKIDMLSMTFSEEYTVEFNCIKNALELGTLARFSPPNFKDKCSFICSTLPEDEKDPAISSKLPVSEDMNIPEIIKTNKIDVVISSGGLQKLIDNTDLKCPWNIPIVVKEFDVKIENGSVTKKKVVFIDKPLPDTNPCKLTLAKKCYKRLLKTNFCHYEAFQFPATDQPVKYKEAEHEPIAKEVENNKIDSNLKQIHHNVNYRIWNVKKSDELSTLMKNKSKNADINVLVRSKLAACEVTEQGVLLPVVLKPKLEHQIALGVNIPSKPELSHEWTSLFFTPFSTLYRARIEPRHSEVIILEKCNIQKIISEAHVHHNFRPQLGLGVLQQVFSKLLDLEVGHYLLQHLAKHEAYASILKHCEESSPDIFDLHAEYAKCSVNEEVSIPWLPLDASYILPAFEANNRYPCTFTPFIWKKNKKFKGKKKKKPKL